MAIPQVLNFEPPKKAQDANQEMSSQFELAENLRKLEKATVARPLGW